MNVVLAAFMIYFTVTAFQEGDIGAGVAGSLLTLIPVISSILVTPCFYIFDSKGVSIYHLFLPKERYLWKNIRTVTVDIQDSPRNIPFLSSAFKIDSAPEGKRRFYMQSNIRKNLRTKRYIERYWDGTVTGYFGEGIKARWKRRKNKKEKEIKLHLTDEIVPMERQARAKAREVLELLIDRAAFEGLELRTEYIYITKDQKELSSRPSEGYEYTLLMEICEKGETDENRVVLLSTALLYVRLGKTAYRGVENTVAREEIKLTVTDMLDEIRKNGIDEYC